MMCTPAFTSWSATLWAAVAGTAMTAAMMLCSATLLVRSLVERMPTPASSVPIFAGSSSKIVTMWKP